MLRRLFSPPGAVQISYLLLLTGATLTGCRWGAVGQNTVGVQLFQQGRYAEALQQFEAAKQTDPQNPEAYYNLASTYHRMGVSQKDAKLTEQAEALYNQCLDLSPNHVACHRGLAVLLVETNRSDKAFKLLKNWAVANPQLSDPRVELANLHAEFQQTAIAEQYLDEVLAKDPNNAMAWAARGRLRETSGDLVQARQNYMQSLSLNSLQPEVYQRLAAVDLRAGQQAFQTAMTATQTTPASGVPPSATSTGGMAGTNSTGAGNVAAQPSAAPPRY